MLWITDIVWMLFFVGGTICVEGQELCDDHSRCISNNQKCDGNNDCLDGSDEADCQSGRSCPPFLVLCCGMG